MDTEHLGVESGISSGIATIFVESSTGENMIVIVPGANSRVTPEDVMKADTKIKNSGAVVVTLELGMEAVRKGMELGRKYGATTILNAAPARADYGRDILENVDILVVNETEAELVAGTEDLDKCGEKLREVCR